MRREDQVEKNLKLARPFLNDLLEDPAALEQIPDGTGVILMPDPQQDPELARANMTLADKLIGPRRRKTAKPPKAITLQPATAG